MSEKPIWAPWRIDYILSEKPKGCVLCDMPADNDDNLHNILYRGETCYVIMNLYPYNNGHMMVTPYRHISDYTELTSEELTESARLTQRCVAAAKSALSAEGFNVGVNQGKSGGAGIEEHLHIHIVPRWIGDHNFMPVIGQTKVIPQHVSETCEMLKQKF
ncbi:HIT family protein [hydrothermal vent metagenome]|uniref:HIT family protein n=1 Tax=hydrothermal vent metagenome TaxID=652676 RepID=A0A3B1C1J9_9ZZZZ